MKIDSHKSVSVTHTASVGLKPKPANFRPGRLRLQRKKLGSSRFVFFSVGLLTKKLWSRKLCGNYLHHYNEAIPKSMSSHAWSEGMKKILIWSANQNEKPNSVRKVSQNDAVKSCQTAWNGWFYFVATCPHLPPTSPSSSISFFCFS